MAIIGNAAEHSTAVWFAVKNKMDLSLGIAIGSSLQISLFVTPVLLFASHLFGKPMILEFSLPEIASIVLAIWIVSQISSDRESNWLHGAQLISAYVIIGILFFCLPEQDRPKTIGKTGMSARHFNFAVGCWKFSAIKRCGMQP